MCGKLGAPQDDGGGLHVLWGDLEGRDVGQPGAVGCGAPGGGWGTGNPGGMGCGVLDGGGCRCPRGVRCGVPQQGGTQDVGREGCRVACRVPQQGQRWGTPGMKDGGTREGMGCQGGEQRGATQ